MWIRLKNLSKCFNEISIMKKEEFGKLSTRYSGHIVPGFFSSNLSVVFLELSRGGR
jgi:hypothetical protein